MDLKFLVDLFDALWTLVVYISFNLGNRELPDIYAHAARPAALGLRHIYSFIRQIPLAYVIAYTYTYVATYVYNTSIAMSVHEHTSLAVFGVSKILEMGVASIVGLAFHSKFQPLKKLVTQCNLIALS